MPKTKKNPVTPLPLAPKLRAALYAKAEPLGRKLTAHIIKVLEASVSEK